MKILFFIILLFSEKIFGKGGGSKGGRSSGSRTGSRGSLRSSRGIRFTSSGRYGRSKLWFSNHYVNIRYVGHHNYYNEHEYNEEDYNINEDIYLIYVINGTFLKNHVDKSKYETMGHYITFTEYNALSDFLQNFTEFQNIFGNETKIIISSLYLDNNLINNTSIDYINEELYQKIMIDVVTDVHYVPFYKLFPKFHIDNIFIFLIILYIFAFLCCILFFYIKFRIIWIKDINFSYIYEFTIVSIIYFIIPVNGDLYLKGNYIYFLSKHSANSFSFIIWQGLQLYFIVYLLSFIINTDNFIYISIILYFLLLILEYAIEESVGFMLKYIIFLKLLYLFYSLILINNKKSEQQNGKEKEMFNIVYNIIILMIISELLIQINNCIIFYIILFDFYLILIALFFSNYKSNSIYIENDKLLFLNKN